MPGLRRALHPVGSFRADVQVKRWVSKLAGNGDAIAAGEELYRIVPVALCAPRFAG